MCFVFCLRGVDLCFYCCLAVGCGVFCVDLCVFLFGMLLCGFIEELVVMLIVLDSPLTGCCLCD